MSINLRRHWKLLVLAIAATVATLVTVGDWRVSALDGSGGTAASTVTFDIDNDVDLLDDSLVHTIELSYDQGDFEAMQLLYETDGTKEWVRADVTIDGVTIENVGIRLKGNSTLFSLSGGGPDGAGGAPGERGGGPPGPGGTGGFGGPPPEGAGAVGFGGAPPGGGGPGIEQAAVSWDEPQGLPLLLRFDEFESDRTYQGMSEVAIRIGGGASVTTDLSEALGYAAVDAAGEPAVAGAYAAVSVNGSEWSLHYVVETIDDGFAEDLLGSNGVLYKALSTGSFDYLGDDPTLYVDAFDQVTGVNEQDLAPVIELLDFINNASDDEFAARLEQYVDVDSFATYVALQNLITNFDDIAGPGNNAYLWYDLDTHLFTVITWDLNLAFTGSSDLDPSQSSSGIGPGAADVGFGPPGSVEVPAGIEVPNGTGVPEGLEAPGGDATGGLGGNVLKERFLADESFAEIYETAYEQAYEAVYGSGLLTDELSALTAVLRAADETFGIADDATLQSEIVALESAIATRAAWLAERLADSD